MRQYLSDLFSRRFFVGTPTGPQIDAGSGSPEGVVTAPVGSLYLRTDGGTGTTVYRKESGSGNTGWVATSGGGSGDVSAAANFGTDNVLIRSDGTGKGVQSSLIGLPDGGELTLPVVASPATPAADNLNLFARKLAGKVMLGTEDQLGREAQLQPMLGGKSVFYCSPANSTTGPTCIGGLLSTVATISHQQTIASANPWQAARRTRFQTNTTAGNATGARTGYTQWSRGNAAGFGGFYFRGQVGMNINLNGGQKFFGLCALTTLLAGDPSALLNMCGMGYDAGDASTGNWFFMRNDGAGVATKVDLGTNAARNTNDGYDLIMYNPPNSGDLFVRIVNLHSGVLVLDTSYNTDLPAVNTGMAYKCDVRNGAVAAADNIEVANVYIEGDLA